MTLGSNTAQTRELGELRNHLKWLDEERRRSARKVTELEQRLAQQGREVGERDTKIKELEWHIANLAERVDRVPEPDSNAASLEQRLQDLEWHLSNIGTQLARVPDPDQERARLQEQYDRAVIAAQERMQTEYAATEQRLMAEVAALREAESRLALNFQALEEAVPSLARLEDRLYPLVEQQQAQAQSVAQLNETIAGLHEEVELMSNRLRERTLTLASESQTNLTALAARFQEHLDALADQFDTRTSVMAAEAQTGVSALTDRTQEQITTLTERLDTLTAVMSTESQTSLTELAARFQARVDELTEQFDTRATTLAAESQTNMAGLAARFQEYLDAMSTEVDQRTAQLTAEWEQKLSALADRGPDLSPQVTRLAQQTSALEQRVADMAALEQRVAEMAALEQRVAEMAALEQRVAEMTALEQRVAEMTALEQRVVEIDAMLAPLASTQDELGNTVSSLPHMIVQLAQLEEAVEAIAPLAGAQNDILRAATALPDVAEQVTRLEESVAKLAGVREIVPLVSRLEEEMELRQAEEVRLANLISSHEGRFVPMATALDEVRETNLTVLSRLSEAERLVEEVRRSTQDFNDNWKPALTEVSRRVGPLAERLTVLNNNILKAEASLQALSGDQSEISEVVVNLTEDVRRSRTETARQLEAWQVVVDEHKDTIERFTQQWLTLSNQYKEARMAVQNFAHWQKQLEQQKRESSELLRIESNRMQARWDGLLIEIQEKLKNFELELGQKWQAFELENEQKWASARRSEQMWREEIGAVDDLIQKLQQDNRTLIWRVQAAQADAIKKWPRLLMEEVEKAVELNPNRRLPAAGATPRGELSVADAIEQGLIKIDYNDETGLDL